jgi:signal transduction histidine kinase
MITRRNPSQSERWSPPLHIVLVIGLWASLVSIFTLGQYLTGLNGPFPMSLGDAAYQALRDWLPWILASPVILWLANRFRMERHTWRSSLAIHLTAGLLLTLAYQVLLIQTRLASPTLFISQIGIGAGGRTGGRISAIAPDELGGLQTASRLTVPGTFEPVQADQVFMRAPLPPDQPGFALALSGPLETEHWRHFFQLALVRSQFTLPLYWAIVVACWAAHYHREIRERERRALELEASLSRANLHALKMQLQPHFLFNALNAISALVHENADAADEMLGSLSDLLRMSLEFSDQHEVSLRQELEFLDCYLAIQQARFGARLRVRKDIDPTTLAARVPTFVLQPFVENAVQHGIEPRRSGGTIVLRAWHSGNRLYLEISDDGLGLAPAEMKSVREGIGLANSKARLRELYGADHHFSLKRNASGGVCVVLELPLRLSGETPPTTATTIPATV